MLGTNAIYSLTNMKLKDETRVRAIKMALVHDIGEALTGDITPSDGVTKGSTLLIVHYLQLTSA